MNTCLLALAISAPFGICGTEGSRSEVASGSTYLLGRYISLCTLVNSSPDQTRARISWWVRVLLLAQNGHPTRYIAARFSPRESEELREAFEGIPVGRASTARSCPFAYPVIRQQATDARHHCGRMQACTQARSRMTMASSSSRAWSMPRSPCNCQPHCRNQSGVFVQTWLRPCRTPPIGSLARCQMWGDLVACSAFRLLAVLVPLRYDWQEQEFVKSVFVRRLIPAAQPYTALVVAWTILFYDPD